MFFILPTEAWILRSPAVCSALESKEVIRVLGQQ